MLSLGKLCEEHGYTYHWKSSQKPHLIKDGKRIDCNIFYCGPFIVPGISTSSSSITPSSASSPSSSQESTSENSDSVWENRDVEAPVSERNRGVNEELRGDPLHDSTETENQNKNREVQRDMSHELPDWLHEFRENLVDESTSEGRRRDQMQRSAHTSSSSHDPPAEPMCNRVLVSTLYLRFFRRIRIVNFCLKSKIKRASCRRRANAVVRSGKCRRLDYCKSQSSK